MSAIFVVRSAEFQNDLSERSQTRPHHQAEIAQAAAAPPSTGNPKCWLAVPVEKTAAILSSPVMNKRPAENRQRR
jgi:hypothetical protein